MAWRMWLRVTSWQTIQMKNIWSILYCDVTKDCMMMNMRWHWELLETKQPAGCNQDFVEERSSRQESAAHPQFLRSFFNLLDTNTIQIRMDANTNMYWAHHRRSCCSSHTSGGHINCILYIIQWRHEHTSLTWSPDIWRCRYTTCVERQIGLALSKPNYGRWRQWQKGLTAMNLNSHELQWAGL